MKQGKVEYYKFHQIILNENDDKHYVYNPAKEEIGVFNTLLQAKDFILETITKFRVSDLEHDGVEIFKYDYRDRIYLISVSIDIFKSFPRFRTYDYYILSHNHSHSHKWTNYLHNEKGPANICLDSKEFKYFWHGKHLTEEQWKEEVSLKKFDNVFDAMLESD